MIIEKLLPYDLEFRVHTLMTGMQFPWYWNAENIVPETPDESLFQLTHMFYWDGKEPSVHWNSVAMIIGYFVQKTNIKVKRIFRVKGNLITNTVHSKQSLNNLIHLDVERNRQGNFVSFVYYVMNSDGDTVVYADDKTEIVETSQPIRGNCIWFDSKTWHRSSVPVNHKRRMVINCILEVE